MSDYTHHKPNQRDAYQLIADSMSDLVCLHENDGTYQWVSPSAKRILGYAPEDLIGENPYNLFHPDDKQRIQESTHEPAVGGAGNIYIRYRIRHAEGHYIWLETLTQPIKNNTGDVIKLHTTSRDVTEQVQLEQALADSEALHRTVLDSLAEGVLVFDEQGIIITVNDQAERILGLNAKDVVGQSADVIEWQAYHLDGRPYDPTELPMTRTLQYGESCRDARMSVRHAFSDELFWLSINSEPITWADHASTGQAAVVVSLISIAHQIRQEALLKQWSLVFRHSQEPIVLIDPEGRISEANEAFLALVIHDRDNVIGQPWSSFQGLEGDAEPVVNQALEKGKWRGELWLRDSLGQPHVTWASLTATTTDQDLRRYLVCILNDYQEKYEEEALVRAQAMHDPLTGLPNRYLFMDRFEMAARSAHRNQTGFACLYIDLDDFKPVNDRLGHTVGDSVLTQVTQRMHSVIREDDTLARLGGDEFVLLITSLDDEDAARWVAEKILSILTEPFNVDAHTIRIGASIGIGLYPQHAVDREALLQVADAAMYRAKRGGGRRWALAGSPDDRDEQAL